MIINIEGNYSTMSYVLTVSTLASATVTVVKNNKTYTQIADNTGMTLFQNLSQGIWAVTATSQDGYLTNTVSIDLQEDTSITIPLNSIPDFTYSISAANGGYAVYDDNGNDITSNPVTQGNWKIKFYKTGMLTINKLNGAANGIDVFCVGGGGNGANYNADQAVPGGGGGGGFTITKRGISVPTGKYDITIGGSGGTTYAFKGTAIEVSAKNGSNGYMYKGASTTDGNGGNGGSGGGGIFASGGSDGYDGSKGGGQSSYAYGGKGQRSLNQGTTTKEFGESTGTLYAGGGGGGGSGAGGYPAGSGGGGGGGKGGGRGAAAQNGTANTGGGGGGGGWAWGVGDNPGSGGSGIVIIRNKR